MSRWTAASDEAFITAFLNFMRESQLPFEAVIFDWFGGMASEKRAMAGPRAAAYSNDGFSEVLEGFRARQPRRPERLSHAWFARENPVHMVIEEVEGLWAPIAEKRRLERVSCHAGLYRRGA